MLNFHIICNSPVLHHLGNRKLVKDNELWNQNTYSDVGFSCFMLFNLSSYTVNDPIVINSCRKIVQCMVIFQLMSLNLFWIQVISQACANDHRNVKNDLVQKPRKWLHFGFNVKFPSLMLIAQAPSISPSPNPAYFYFFTASILFCCNMTLWDKWN